MSETVTLSTGPSETIHGTYAAAQSYIGGMFGDTYAAWAALAAVSPLTADDRKKQTLIAAVRYLNSQAWNDDADTFAEREAIAAFTTAQYELAVIIANDPSVLAALDSSSNIQSVAAGSASVSYFAPTSVALGTATRLPPVLQRLIGSYLAAASVTAVLGGYGNEGDCESPFSECSDINREEPY